MKRGEIVVEVFYDRRLRQGVRLVTLEDGTVLDSRKGDEARIAREMKLARRRSRAKVRR